MESVYFGGFYQWLLWGMSINRWSSRNIVDLRVSLIKALKGVKISVTQSEIIFKSIHNKADE